MARLALLAFLGVAALAVQVQAMNCMFLNDNGVPLGVNKYMTSVPPLWGDIHTRLNGICDSITFYRAETRKQTWSKVALEYCQAMKEKRVDVVFAHGAANLAIAYGINKALATDNAKANADYVGCKSIGQFAGTVHWYNIGAPMKGADAFDPSFLSDYVCKGYSHRWVAAYEAAAQKKNPRPAPLTPVSALPDSTLQWICEDNMDRTPFASVIATAPGGVESSREFEDMRDHDWKPLDARTKKFNNPVPDFATQLASRMARGSLCGARPGHKGLVTSNPSKTGYDDSYSKIADYVAEHLTGPWEVVKDWAGIKDGAVSAEAVPKVGNDGLVSLRSCMLSGDAYSRDPASRRYVMDGEHSALTCLYGDAAHTNPKNAPFAPCEWIVNMAKQSKAEKQLRGTTETVNSWGPVTVKFAEVFDEHEDEEADEEADADEQEDEEQDEQEDEQEMEAEAEDEAAQEMDF